MVFMLQSIRDHTQGWIAGIIISLLILSFALWGIHSYLEGGATNTTVVAKVDGVPITKGQLAVTYERLRREWQSQFNTNLLSETVEAALKQRALQTLIDIQVLKQGSTQQNYRISSRQVDSYLESMPEFQVNGQFSLARFQRFLSATLFTGNDFLDLIRTNLLMDQPRLGLLFTSFALPNEIATTISLVNQERDIAYVSLPNAYFLQQPFSVSTDEIQTYYKQHQEEFKTLEQVSIDYVLLSLKEVMATIHPTEAMLKNFYDENANSFAKPAVWKIQSALIPLPKNATEQDVIALQNKANDVLQKIKKQGQDFGLLTQQFPMPEDAQHRFEGWVMLNQLPSEMQKAVLASTKIGQVGLPVRMPQGFVLFKVIGYKEPIVQSFSEIKEKIKESYIRQQAEEKFADLKEKLANVSYEHPDSLQLVTKTFSLPIKTSELFTKEKGANDITSNAKIREVAFSNDVLNLQNNSDVIQVGGDTAVVLRVKSHMPSTLLPLTVVEKAISDKLKTRHADEENLQFAKDIALKLQQGTSLEHVAKEHALVWHSLGLVGRHAATQSNGDLVAVLDAAFAMPTPENKAFSYAVVKGANNYIVIALKSVKSGAIHNDHTEYTAFAEQIQNTEGLLEYLLYKQSLTNQASIVLENQK